MMRSVNSRIGDHQPMMSNVGSKPMQNVDSEIMRIVKTSTFWRPMRSPRGPRTAPPIGRTRNDTAKPNSTQSVEFSESPKMCEDRYPVR